MKDACMQFATDHAAGAPLGSTASMASTGDPLFASFFMGGFECSIHYAAPGRRLDMIAATRHDELAAEDYRRLASFGMRVARDGLRWHLIESRPGRYDFDSVRPMVRAALETGIQVIWDLLHFGWPDHVDVFAPEFPERLAALAHGFAQVIAEEGDPHPAVAPVNEISFLSFAAGEAGFFPPYANGRGDELKRQLVAASLAAGRAFRAVHPHARLIHTDPIIHVVTRPDRAQDRAAAAAHADAQYHSWDMIAGRRNPELGGTLDDLDVLGVNYYIHNQWYYPGGHGSMVNPSSPLYRPVSEMLVEVHRRYGRPMFIAETGIEDEARAPWLAYMCHESRAAIHAGADLRGLCLYPIVNHPGWSDDRHCYNGLWDYADESGERAYDEPLGREIQKQSAIMRRFDPSMPWTEAPPDLARLDPIANTISEVTATSREG